MPVEDAEVEVHVGDRTASPLTVVVDEERHDTNDVTLSYLGLGPAPSVVVAATEQGRLRLDRLATCSRSARRARWSSALQAGNVNSGSFDPLGAAVDLVHRHGGWAHVDGAFGLWAAAAPGLRHLTDGLAPADFGRPDAHETLNVPYDIGIAVVTDAAALRAAMGVHAAYPIQDERPDPIAVVPEFSRRARGFTARAALRSLGRGGVADLVEQLTRRAARFADALGRLDGVQVVNDAVFTQVCVAFDGDTETREVARRLLEEGTAWMTPSVWQGRAVLRISVSTWRTTEDDVDPAVAAVGRVPAHVHGGAQEASAGRDWAAAK